MKPTNPKSLIGTKVSAFNPINKSSHEGIIVEETTIFVRIWNPDKDVCRPENAELWPIEFCKNESHREAAALARE